MRSARTQEKHESLVDRVRHRAREAYHADVLVPVQGSRAVQLSLDEIAGMAASESPSSVTILVDSAWAGGDGTLWKLIEGAAWAGILGTLPESLPKKKRVHVLAEGALPKANEHVLLIRSSAFHAAFLTTLETDSEETSGFWTTLPPLIDDIQTMLLDGTTHQPPTLPEADPERTQMATLRLSSRLASAGAMDNSSSAIREADLSALLEILKSISAKRGTREVLSAYTELIASKLDIDRCSVVRIWDREDTAYVLASHDDDAIDQLPIALENYPELQKVLDTGSTVVVNDMAEDPLTRGVQTRIAQSGITSVLVVPVLLYNRHVGSVLLRAARRGRPFTTREIRFCEIAADSATNALERADLFESIQQANKELELLARTDSLTGLFNRRYFSARLDEEVSRSLRYKTPLACLFIDIDDFKEINDTYGHIEGDRVLQEIAIRTLKSVRSNDIVARYGGEEFVAILPQTGKAGATKQALRLLQRIEGAPYAGLPEERRMTVSIGVSVFDEERVNDPEAMLVEADAALYLAKDRGKNRVVVGNTDYTP